MKGFIVWMMRAALWLAVVPPAGAQMIGVLEDVPGAYAGEGNSFKVRAVFFRDGEDWRAFPSNCEDTVCLRTVTRNFP
jgi:hypothetical protein